MSAHPTPDRVPSGVPTGGQFASTPRSESFARLTAPDGREAYRVVDGVCINCGHLDDHDYCEYCSPTCGECGEEREDPDRSLCDFCQEKEDEYDDATWD